MKRVEYAVLNDCNKPVVIGDSLDELTDFVGVIHNSRVVKRTVDVGEWEDV